MKKLALFVITIILAFPSFAQESLASTLIGLSTGEENMANINLDNFTTEKLLQRDRQCANAAATSNMEVLWGCWTDDAVMLMSTEFQVEGKEEIKAFTLRSREDPNFRINWTAIGAEVSPHGDMGYTYGNGTVSRTGKNGQVITVTQPYLSVWKKEKAGEWKIVIEK